MRLDWASEAVHSALQAKGGSAVGAICALALAARDERELGLLGTGPLEVFLHESPDRMDVDLLVEATRLTPRLQCALSHVWWSEVDHDIARRLQPLAS
jgi:hypothetical protein